MSYRYFIGIDPGLSGGVSIYDHYLNVLTVRPMPVLEEAVVIKGKKKTRRQYNLPALCELLDFAKEDVGGVAVEKVTARPGEGTTSSFRFGWGAGAIESMIVTKHFPLMMVRPQVWKAYHELLGSEKDDSRAKASVLFPQCAPYWKLKKQDGLAESALMCAWGANKQGFTLDNPAPGDTFKERRKRKGI